MVCGIPTHDRRYDLITVATTCGSLALLAVFMRLFVAWRQNNFGYDDVCAVLACCAAVSNFVICPWQRSMDWGKSHGLGKVTWTVETEDTTQVLKVSFYGCMEWQSLT
jgi:hypothetical protein